MLMLEKGCSVNCTLKYALNSPHRSPEKSAWLYGPEEDSYPNSGYTSFRGGKGTTWEGGVRVPGNANWPGIIKPGRVSDGLFDLMDLFNTSLAVAGIKDKIPSERYIDGIDQSSFLLSDDGETNRQAVFMHYQLRR